jgi:hypothetical protein
VILKHITPIKFSVAIAGIYLKDSYVGRLAYWPMVSILRMDVDMLKCM